MMRRFAAVVLFSMLHGFQSIPARQQGRTDFAPLEFLVGSCWKGTFPDGKVTDEHCFEWVFDRKFIRDRHVVRGGAPYQGETLYRWDPVEKRIAYWYWGSEGLVVVGHVELAPEGIVFPSTYATAAGEVELKAVWTRLGPDSYRVVQSQPSNGVWKTLWTMDLTRQ
jgi:hypothetical protein